MIGQRFVEWLCEPDSVPNAPRAIPSTAGGLTGRALPVEPSMLVSGVLARVFRALHTPSTTSCFGPHSTGSIAPRL